MKEPQDFALLLDEYARLKTRFEQMDRERKWLLQQVKTKQQALSKTQKALERLNKERAQERQEKQPGKKPAISNWVYRLFYIISIVAIPVVWYVLLIIAISKARWDANGWTLVAVLLFVTPVSILFTLQRSHDRQRWQRLYQPRTSTMGKRVSIPAQPAEKEPSETPRRRTQKSRAPITRKLSEQELEPIANAL